MKQPSIVIAAILLLVLMGVGGFYLYDDSPAEDATAVGAASGSPPKRPGSPTIGEPLSSKVEIVEFFDPACEGCRAFYPYVKEQLDKHPGKVRLTLRYATFHDGSDYVAKVLEAARLQGQEVYVKALEAVLGAQPMWADHGNPQPQRVWEFLGSTGLDIDRARRDMDKPEIAARLEQDQADIVALQVRRTPTFFINGQPLMDFSESGLDAQVQREVNAAYP